MSRTRRGLGQGALAAILVVCCSLVTAAPASGHAFAPSRLEVRETTPGHALVRWKQPAVRATGSSLLPIISENCLRSGEPHTSVEDTGMVASWEIDCMGGLVGQTIRVEGIEASQLVFVGAVLAAWAALRALPVRWPSPATYLPAYAMGTLSAFWFFQRLAASFTSLR
ncbi:MAG: hypothetical protein HY268_25170 [Deltaproteobacteria bacterium]|nr:hypothetical protein [Deltaproteobacteria bacterium]